MTLIYINGGAPDYLGFGFTDSDSLLTKIRDELINAGWATETDARTASDYIVMKAQTTNSHYCWIKFSTSVVSGSQERLSIQGDLDGTETTLSPSVTIDYDSSLGNKLYLTCDNDAGCIGIVSLNAGIPIRSAHFGFLDRIDTTDSTAAMVGLLISWNQQSAYIMQSKHANVAWRKIGDDYYNSSNYNGVNPTALSSEEPLSIGQIDFCNRILINDRDMSNSSAQNTSYMIAAGNLNAATGQPLIAPFYYIEGRGATNRYGTSGGTKAGIKLSPQLYFRGNVKFAITGISSLLEGEQAIASDGSRYLSGGTIGWQGFKIKGAD